MRLSELKTGDKAVIVKVLGHGGFRKRIVEMGFIRGNVVEVLLSAPLRDPIKYRLLGYEISLRRDEAALIDVMTPEEALQLSAEEKPLYQRPIQSCQDDCQRMVDDDDLRKAAMRKRRTINVALVGNPNCGKTSLFNFASGAHERVGNYSGVTVDAKEGRAFFEGYEFNLVDLPGTYSLTAYSPEEMYVRKQIVDKTPDVILNVIDASNIERNLYLTTQLIDMNQRVVCALNMYDELESRGDKLDREKLGQLLGVPMIPTVFKTGQGVKTLFHVIINMYEGLDFIDEHGNINPDVADDIKKWHDSLSDQSEVGEHDEDFASGKQPRNNVARHIHVNHGQYVEAAIGTVQATLKAEKKLRSKYSTRYLAIKLLENDKEVEKVISDMPGHDRIIEARDRAERQIQDDLQTDSETAIMDAKYGFIRGALAEAGYKMGDKLGAYKMTHAIDAIVTHHVWGFPFFFAMLFLMFEVTFALGQFPMDWIEEGVGMLGDWLGGVLPAGPVRDMVIDGALAGVGSVIVFLPQILILYFFISLMEDSGYMARAAFIMDKFMHKMGLHGKSFIPLIMGFGCNVPAIMATRTIESRRSRLVTMLILPFMSCSARLPIYIMIVGTFFAARWQAPVLVSIYAIGILAAVLLSRLFCRFFMRDDDTPFVMELPPYRFPTAKAIARHTWERGRQYLKKMGGIILVASVVVWALGYFPRHEELGRQEQQEQSFIGRIGQAVEPIFRPQGFSWKQDVSIIAGVGAKEIVASTLGVLYADDDSFADDDSLDAAKSDGDGHSKYVILRQKMEADGMSPIGAYAYLLFILLYFPCLATVAAVKAETGSWKWAVFLAFETTFVAWVVSALFYRVAMLFA